MKLDIGTILEPKFDSHIEYAVFIEYYTSYAIQKEILYGIRTLKTNKIAYLTEKELYERYNPIGQAEVGRALFGDVEQQVGCGNGCIDCQCGKRVN